LTPLPSKWSGVFVSESVNNSKNFPELVVIQIESWIILKLHLFGFEIGVRFRQGFHYLNREGVAFFHISFSGKGKK
jgi:hypothetical protein